MTTPAMTLGAPARRGPSLVFPLVLIALGTLFLLANAGFVTGVSLRRLIDLWPVILVMVGLDLILRPRSLAAAVAAEVALVAASLLYLVAAPAFSPGPAATDEGFAVAQGVARDGAAQLSLRLEYGAGRLDLAGGGSDLVSVRSTRSDVDVREVSRIGTSAAVNVRSGGPDTPFGVGDRRWDVRLPSDVPVALTLDLGAGDFEIDLHAVQVSRATVNSGAANLVIDLPTPKGDLPVRISTGASSISLQVPPGVQYRVRTQGVLTSTSGLEESPGYAGAADRLSIDVSAAASSISIR